MTTSGRIQILRADERPATTWLNGGGVTREVAGFPTGAGLDAFDWRVSLADVASAGPFSPFPGVDRVITLVEGPGMTLTVDGAEHLVDMPFRPFAFPGDAATDCRLPAGPVVDFNVMTRRGRVGATVDVLTAPAAVDVPPEATVLLVCLAGGAVVGDEAVLDRFDAALPAGPGTCEVRVRTGGAVAVVTLRSTPAP
ncbi:environmental stress-induced protein Ves [Kitasatospora sp. MAA19]|uniref:HutD/Ves family protein n=1 Tax=unclassified Kitasatospora TaxID=2633591 RepID=UPI0024763582|nr:HutD family protein [Kitasatospora sp. MAA19]MDH6710216.1 environmental stress-induced protein Ves [Kitasatospora sp. MAA19]